MSKYWHDKNTVLFLQATFSYSKEQFGGVLKLKISTLVFWLRVNLYKVSCSFISLKSKVQETPNMDCSNKQFLNLGLQRNESTRRPVQIHPNPTGKGEYFYFKYTSRVLLAVWNCSILILMLFQAPLGGLSIVLCWCWHCHWTVVKKHMHNKPKTRRRNYKEKSLYPNRTK